MVRVLKHHASARPLGATITMTDTIVTTAPEQPAPVAQISSEKKDGASNTSQSEFSKRLAAKQTAPVVFQAPPTVEAKPVEQKTEETKETPVAEVTETEAKTEAKAETAEAKDDALSKISPNAEKRINELIARAKTAEEKADALQRRLDQTPVVQPVVAPTPDNPLANVNDIDSLKKELVSAKETKLWAQQQLNRRDLANGVRVGDQTYTEDQFRDALNNIERRIEIDIPARAEFLTKRANADRLASENFEFLADASDERNRLMAQVLAANPSMASLPNARYLAAAAVEGQTQVNLRKALAADRQGTRPVKQGQQAPASQLAAGGAVGAATREIGGSRAKAALEAEMGRLKKSGHVSTRDVASYFRQKMG